MEKIKSIILNEIGRFLLEVDFRNDLSH